MFNGNVGHQEILFTRRVFALFTFEWFVIGVGQLVIEQVLLVIADVLTELTFKRAVATVLYVREKMHFESVALLEGFPTLVTHVRFLCAVCLHVLRQAFLHGIYATADGAWKLTHFGNHICLSTLAFVVDS